VTPPPVTPPVTPTETMGFRVQIVATAYLANAEKIASEARMKFPEKVYVEYIAPYYKVRIGDCVSRGDVNALRMKARQMGYRDAWIVETMVRP